MLKRRPTRELTQAGLVLARAPDRRRTLAAGAVALLLLGAAAALWLPQGARLRQAAEDRARGAAAAEQQRLALDLATARARALEAQIDELNQRLRECREQLAFFRQSGEARR